MKVIDAEKNNGVLRLGRCGENQATTVLFPINKWIKDFGEGGEAILLVMRPEDVSPYITTTILDGETVKWIVSSTDTAQPGIGYCELQYISEDAVVKSRIWKTVVTESLEDAGESPDPESGWVANLLQTIQEMLDDTNGSSLEVATDEEVEEMLSEVYEQ